jgi:exodeoxyribonuclease-5
MEFNEEQRDTIRRTVSWYKSGSKNQIWEIAGVSGSGKTTIVYAIIEELGLNKDEEVVFATYTGKAALVLTLKGCPATTIHKLIYAPKEIEVNLTNSKGEVILNKNNEPLTRTDYIFVKRKYLHVKSTVTSKPKDKESGEDEDTSASDAIKLIVIDECSMVDEEMLNDLKSFNLPIIVLGDICQLAPIRSKPVLLKNPDCILTHVMRQAENDPIVYLATLARTGKRIETGKYGKSYVISRRDLDNDMVNNTGQYDKILSLADIIISRTNKSRDMINNYMRSNILGFDSELPVLGDKLICRKNNWVKISTHFIQ